MRLPKPGMRIIKTVIAVFLSIAVFIILMLIDSRRNIEINSIGSFTIMYTPFFAAIAAVYALHRDTKSSLNQAKIRGLGSIFGGYYGMVIVLIFEFLLLDVFNIENKIIYNLFFFLIISISIIPLIQFTVAVKQASCVFITCLTYFSVTISIRNGGMPVILFATNRVLSTLIGIGISLIVNNIMLLRRKNKDVLFVTSIDNNLLMSRKNEISPFIKYKLNNLYYKDMPLTLVTTRTLSSLEYLFDDVEIGVPLVVMNGAAIYHFKDKKYDDVYNIDNDARKFIDQKLKEQQINSFIYSIDDNMLHCYYSKIENNGEKAFYNIRRKNNFDNFVRAELPDDAGASLYIIIDKKEKIDGLVGEINSSNYKSKVDLIVYAYNEIDEDYYYLKINSHDSTKEKLVNKLKKDGNYNNVIVCGSGHTDLELIKNADFSISLSTAPIDIKEEVDVVIDENPENILKIFERIYHSKNINKTINKIKSKYRK